MLGTRAMGTFGLLLLASCGGAQTTYTPDGRQAYILECKGGRYACARQAGDLCGSRGYQALDQAGRPIPAQIPLGNVAELMITCRDGPQTIYGGESHPAPQSGSGTTSTLMNQPGR